MSKSLAKLLNEAICRRHETLAERKLPAEDWFAWLAVVLRERAKDEDRERRALSRPKRCETCGAWAAPDESDDDDEMTRMGLGQCRAVSAGGIAEWPGMPIDGWCAEWRPREQETT